MSEGRIARRERRRIDDEETTLGEDALPIEAPLTIQVVGETVATTMRTPGSDPALVAGFLLAEGLIGSAADLGALVHCGDVEAQAAQHTMDVRPGPGFHFDIGDELRRGTLSTSSCGVCGREQITDLLARIRPPKARKDFTASEIRSALGTLASEQMLFERTGSIHGAALFDSDLNRLSLDEDVGRHNAIDKVVGRALLDKSLKDARLLALSGRVSFEVVQKAAAAGIGTIATRKGLTTMAADLAKEASITVCAFVRDTRLSKYGWSAKLIKP
ncbi:MAG: formate dehydrogenase accessory sulfurtransferase FdhD [Polyangiales bacterium]